MFSKKTCKRCGRKASKDSSFCSHCGAPLKKDPREENEDFGMLGRNDSFNEMESFSNSIFNEMGGMNFGFMNKMIANTMKMIEKEMQKEAQRPKSQQNAQNMGNFPGTKIRLMINGKEIDLNNNLPKNPQNPERKEKKTNPIKFMSFSEDKARKFSKLPKKEPKTELKRIADKITYEIMIPGVKSIEEVSITPLESSIEVKAISNDRAYSKSIPISLPIKGYNLSEGVLILEFKGE